MTQADNIYASLMGRCAEPSVADQFLKGFSGAQGYRDRYANEYKSKCVTASGEVKPNTSVFTPEVMQQQAVLQQQIQNTGQPPAAVQPPPVAQPPP
ncbi:MAG: hypothetical protein ACO35C_03990, partial [Pontimonas sp.]